MTTQILLPTQRSMSSMSVSFLHNPANKEGQDKTNSKHIPSGSNCVVVIVADGGLSSSGFLDLLWEGWVRVQRSAGVIVGVGMVRMVRMLGIGVGVTSNLSFSFLLLAILVVQPCVRVSGICTELIELIELIELVELGVLARRRSGG